MQEAIQTVLENPTVLNASLFCVAALVGQIFHAIKKWAEGYNWIMDNFRRTIGAVIGNITGMIGFVSSGALDNIGSMGTLLALGLFMGLSADSVLNAGSRVKWTK